MRADPRGLLTIAALSLALTALAGVLLRSPQVAYAADGTSLRFYGGGPGDIDRVKIPLGPLEDAQLTASYPVNVAHDFTLEFWMRATADENRAPDCESMGWYYGNIMIDRDVDGAGDYGDYGVALCDQRIAFGVSAGDDDRLLISTVVVADGQWHHIALTRADGGAIAIFVDGQPAGSREGPVGRIDYRTRRPTDQPQSDPYLVIGAEKHDYPGSSYYSGFIDELRISDLVRYDAPFTRPGGPLEADSGTVALYHFDEGAGTTVHDSSTAAGGPADGLIKAGGPQNGPVWSTNTPANTPSAEPPDEPMAEPTSEPAGDLVVALSPAAPTAESSPIPTAAPVLASPVAPPTADQAVPTAIAFGMTAAEAGASATAVVAGAAVPGEGLTARPTPQSEPAPPPESNAVPVVWALAIAAGGLTVAILAVVGWRRV